MQAQKTLSLPEVPGVAGQRSAVGQQVEANHLGVGVAGRGTREVQARHVGDRPVEERAVETKEPA